MSTYDSESRSEFVDRKEILEILADNVRALDNAIDRKPAETPEDERLRLEQLRTLGSLAGEFRKLQKEHRLDEAVKEIEMLREQDTVEH